MSVSPNPWQRSSNCGEAGNCPELRWQKSSYSADAGNCINIGASAASPGPRLRLRESEDPTQILTTTPARLAALLAAVKADRRCAP